MTSHLLLLSILLVYYPIHPTAYIYLTKYFPNIPTQLFSSWQDLIIIIVSIMLIRNVLHKIVLKLTPIDYIIALLFAMSFPSALKSGLFDYATIVGFRVTYMPILLYFAIRFIPAELAQYRRFINLILITSSIVAVIGVLIYFMVPIELINIWYALNKFTVGYYQDIRRMDSIFWSPVVFGSLMALSCIFCYSLSYEKNGTYKKVAYYSGVILFGFCCVLSLSRGSWVNMLLGIIIVTLANIRTKTGLASLLSLVAACVFLLGSSSISSDNPWGRHIATIFSSDKQVGSGEINRSEQREGGLEDIRNNILFGRGLGKSGHIAARDQETHDVDYTVIADNWYLKFFQETGIVGFSVFMLFVSYALLYITFSYLNMKCSAHKPLILGIGASFAGFSLQGYGSNVWDFYMLNTVFWILLGIAVNVSQMWRGDQSHPGYSPFTRQHSIRQVT